jgi:hypothetical protein
VSTSFIDVLILELLVGQGVVGLTRQDALDELALLTEANELGERFADGRRFLILSGKFLDLLQRSCINVNGDSHIRSR